MGCVRGEQGAKVQIWTEHKGAWKGRRVGRWEAEKEATARWRDIHPSRPLDL